MTQRASTGSALRTVLVRLAVVLVMAELITWAAFALSLRRALASVLYDPPITQAVSQYDQYLARRDPRLGWPSPHTVDGPRLDRTGSRRVPAFPEPGGACISLYGDSFTFGDEVDDEHAWGNQLAHTLGCRVANYGTNGYGIDQAFLRFRENAQDEAPLVLLTIYPQNVMRSVNQLRALLTGTGTFLSFKPRFVLAADGTLTLVPLPTPSKTDLPPLLKDPSRFLHHEYFLPGTPPGPVPYGFPHLRMLIRLLYSQQVHDGIEAIVSKRPFWADFYEPGHPSGSFELTAAILQAFHDDAERRGKRPLVLMLPTPSSMSYFERTGRTGYQRLLEHVTARGLQVVDLGPPFRGVLHGRPFVEITTKPISGGGHFSEEGARLHAEIVAHILDERGLVPAGDRRQVGATSPGPG